MIMKTLFLQGKCCMLAMRFELIVWVLAIVVKHSNASRDESTCSYLVSRKETNWCWGPLENIQCNAPVFKDDRKCMNKNETLALFEELLTGDLEKEGIKSIITFKNWITKKKEMVINKFEDNQSSTCLTRMEEGTEGLESLEVRSKIVKIKE